MKGKIFSFGIISVLLWTSIISITAIGTSINYTNPIETLSEPVVDVGDITIDKQGETVIVDCVGTRAFNIGVGSGSTVTVNVDYSIRCPGSADDGYVEISFSDGSDSDSYTYGGDTIKTGTLTISKYIESNEYFVVNIYGKYTDWYGTQTLGEDEDKGFGGSCNGFDVDAAFIWLSPNYPPGIVPYLEFDGHLPSKIDVGEYGSLVIFNVNYQNDYYNWPYHNLNRVGFSVTDNFNLDFGDNVHDPPEYGVLSAYGFITPGKRLRVEIWGCAYDNCTMCGSIFRRTDVYWGLGNNPPTITIDAPRKVKFNKPTDIKFTPNDPAGHDCYIMIDWVGDGYYTGWLGPYKSGELVTISHTWTEYDSSFMYPFHLTAIAKDVYYLEGEPTEHILRAGWFGDRSIPFQKFPLISEFLARIINMMKLLK